VRRKVVRGISFPPDLVCFPPAWNVETKIDFREDWYVGSSQNTGNELLTRSLPTSPTAIGAGHEPRKNKTTSQ
jgi:hypothetical protein